MKLTRSILICKQLMFVFGRRVTQASTHSRTLITGLKTRNQLVGWGVVSSAACVMCHTGFKDNIHLFFCCTFSQDIWMAVLARLGHSRGPLPWDHELHWCISHFAGKNFEDVRIKASTIELKVTDDDRNRQFIYRWDGSLSTSSAGFGAIIRDSDGEVIAAVVRGSRPKTITFYEL
ncbi:hypothetical protein BVC80_7473g4 [Macleaya cordata]|uniref:Reverse transcriptase zinc-binding domain-containing protein n=1 Tax=Macleaya cordata TaxID=56857 RepID=A0A200PTA1_MACCD|nr:hypothetical protein BVC80_7473g4 [Macleaya cordata]